MDQPADTQPSPVWLLKLKAAVVNVLGFSITGILSLTAFFVGVVYKLTIHWWANLLTLKFLKTELPNPIAILVFIWAWATVKVCYGILDIKTVVNRDNLSALDLNKPIIVESNHPTIPAVLGFVYTLESGLLTDRPRTFKEWLNNVLNLMMIGGRIRFVIKRENLLNPLGLGIWALGIGTFINRKNRHAALASIIVGRTRALRGPHVMFIFPDQHRPSAEGREADIAKYEPKNPGLRNWLLETRFPRAGGIYQMLVALPDEVQVISMTNTFDVQEEGVFDVPHLDGATLHLILEDAPAEWRDLKALDVDDQYRELKEFQPSLQDVYKLKNRRIHEIKYGEGAWTRRALNFRVVGNGE